MTPKELVQGVAAPLVTAALAVYAALAAFGATPVAVAQSEGADEWADPLLKLLTLLALGAGWVVWLRRPSWIRHRYGIRWLAASALSSLALLATHQVLSERWTVQYVPEQALRIVVGWTLRTLEAGAGKGATVCGSADARCHLEHWQGDARLAYVDGEAASRLLALRALRVATYSTSLLALLVVAAAVFAAPAPPSAGDGSDSGQVTP